MRFLRGGYVCKHTDFIFHSKVDLWLIIRWRGSLRGYPISSHLQDVFSRNRTDCNKNFPHPHPPSPPHSRSPPTSFESLVGTGDLMLMGHTNLSSFRAQKILRQASLSVFSIASFWGLTGVRYEFQIHSVSV